ncbi:MAG: hypothetical protein ACXAEN_25475 [Candidatus Thorarchaeota archaeon]
MRKQIITKHFTRGPAPKSVKKQSGKLQKSIRFSRAKPEGNLGATADLTIGTKYATTHIARKNRGKTRITAKRGKLAIPMAAARDSRGVPIAPPLDPRWAPTKIVENIIWGQVGGATEPLFVLKKSVVVPQRISLFRDIIRPGEVILKQQISAETKKIL